jgi:hypothetical protein
MVLRHPSIGTGVTAKVSSDRTQRRTRRATGGGTRRDHNSPWRFTAIRVCPRKRFPGRIPERQLRFVLARGGRRQKGSPRRDSRALAPNDLLQNERKRPPRERPSVSVSHRERQPRRTTRTTGDSARAPRGLGPAHSPTSPLLRDAPRAPSEEGTRGDQRDGNGAPSLHVDPLDEERASTRSTRSQRRPARREARETPPEDGREAMDHARTTLRGSLTRPSVATRRR